MPKLPNATGPVQPGPFDARFELITDSCGNMPPDSERGFEIGVVGDTLVVQFENASWACTITAHGTFDCPIAQEGQRESEGQRDFLERRARGSYRADGSFSFQVQSQTYCDGKNCERAACVWAFAGTAAVRQRP